jgi:predicted DNA-binding transcriptional regulator YafY
MSRQEGQKAKILTLLHILEHKSDEAHRLSVPQLEEALAQENVPAERKSIYADLSALQAAGYDVELQRGRGGGYYLGERTFQLAELKLLVDAVQSSRFITKKKSAALIKKLESLTSEYQARLLQRQVFVSGRVKNMNESVYYTVDALHQAIAAGRMVSFRYLQWTPEKKRIPRRDGMLYRVSPWALAWENGNYYLIAYEDYEEPAGIRHYRLDLMANVTVLDAPRCGRAQFENFDLAAYLQQMFGMYTGRRTEVTLRCDNKLAGAMLDRFGTEVTLLPEADGAHFHLTVPVAVSPQFLGWVCGFGSGMHITYPESVRAQMRALTGDLAGAYAAPPPE